MPRVQLDQDIKPLSEFRSRAASFVQQVRDTKRPLVLTHHGRSVAVLLDVAEYENLLEKTEVLDDIRAAEAQIAQGQGTSHKTAKKQVLERISK